MNPCLVPRPTGKRESVFSPPTQPGNVDMRQGEPIDLDVLIGAHCCCCLPSKQMLKTQSLGAQLLNLHYQKEEDTKTGGGLIFMLNMFVQSLIQPVL